MILKIQATERGKNFFIAYLETTKLESIPRGGFALWGVYSSDQDMRSRAQSDAEHCAGMHVMADLIPMFYPEIFNTDHAYNYSLMATLHELGEIKLGRDIPDDGSIDHDTKDGIEKDYVFSIIDNCYPKEHRASLKKMYEEFQNRGTYFGKTAYLLDKFDAVLRGFVYEFNGKSGMLHKKASPSGRDLDSAKFTKVDNLPDNWLYGMISGTVQDVRLFPNLEVFLEICQSAAVYVRGEKMEWLERI